MKAKVNRLNIEIVQGDIYSLPVMAIVVMSDSNVTVSPALHAKAGAALSNECNRIGWCEVGSAVVTGAGRLNFRKIIHAVGPRWGEGSERGKLANVTWHCLNLAEEYEIESLAIPALSTGSLGYPLENCAMTMLIEVIDFSFEKLKHLRTVLVCVDNDLALGVFEQELHRQLEHLKGTGEARIRV